MNMHLCQSGNFLDFASIFILVGELFENSILGIDAEVNAWYTFNQNRLHLLAI